MNEEAVYKQAITAYRNGRFAEAEGMCTSILRNRPDHFDALHLSSICRSEQKDFTRALDLLRQALAANPVAANAHNSLGNLYEDMGRPDEALASYAEATTLKPDFGVAWFNQGNVLRKGGRLEEAASCFRHVLALEPDNAFAWHNLGIVLHGLGRLVEAEASDAYAVALRPNYAEAHNNRGNVLRELNRLEEALSSYDRALALRPNYAIAHNNRGNTLRALQRQDEAMASHDEALKQKPDFMEAHFDRGQTLRALGRPEDALSSYDQALRLSPDVLEIHTNRGNVLEELKRYEEALASYDRAIAVDSSYAGNFTNKGTALFELKRYDQALSNYDKALAIMPDQPYLLGSWLYTKLHVCDWTGFEEGCRTLAQAINRGDPSSPPFALLATPSSPALQLDCAKSYANDKFPPSRHPVWQGEHYAHDRIRVGYFSSDYRNHPMAQLTAGLFENHDRARFEIIGFAFGGPTDAPIRKRLESAFERFIDVGTYTDREVADLVRTLEIDIAVDLNGFTADARTGIFALRPAPIQVNYMGYPGSMGTRYIDYILADAMIIPESDRVHYSEHVVYLPHTYQVNDDAKEISQREFSRSDLGLPEQGFVFCCFNNIYKLTPDVFDIWMRLLHQVDGSVLWLLEGNAAATSNLHREALNRGIAPDRLVFAPRMDLADHLARHKQADLFMDTLYYNAHTTASDALWASLPVLTCLGNTFAGRVAASLLNAIGLPELIAHDRKEYEALALAIALDPARMRETKSKLARHRTTYPLFDTARFTRNLEAAYSLMLERYQAGLTPDAIVVEE
jgi:predicted O-linked N-acetylglucosamine transferase (SPINDLY family)